MSYPLTPPVTPTYRGPRDIKHYGYRYPGVVPLDPNPPYEPDLDRNIPPEFLQESLAYSYDYKSGAQINLFLNGVLVDELTFIQFEAVYPRIPVYGYGSEFWDAVGRGRVIVHGVLGINFKAPGYLRTVMCGPGSLTSEDRVFNDLMESLQISSTDPSNRSAYGRNGAMVLSGLTPVQLDKFQQFVEKSTLSARSVSETWRGHPLHKGPCTIQIFYGDPAEPKDLPINHQLNSVILTTAGQSCQISGEPLQEVYQFVARELQDSHS